MHHLLLCVIRTVPSHSPRPPSPHITSAVSERPGKQPSPCANRHACNSKSREAARAAGRRPGSLTANRSLPWARYNSHHRHRRRVSSRLPTRLSQGQQNTYPCLPVEKCYKSREAPSTREQPAADPAHPRPTDPYPGLVTTLTTGTVDA